VVAENARHLAPVPDPVHWDREVFGLLTGYAHPLQPA
jgi:hypothetical protein